MNDEPKETEVSISQLFAVVLAKWWVVVISAVLGAALLFGYTKIRVTPMYSATAMLYVNNKSISVGGASLGISAADISTSRSLVDTYRVILSTRLTLEEVIKRAEVPYSYGQLKSMISTSAVNGTAIFSVTVQSPDPEEACKIANTIVAVLPEKISSVIEGTSVKTVDLAVVPGAPSSPSYLRNALTGFILGAVIGVAILILKEWVNDTITSEDWLTTAFKEKIPVLSVVPDITQKSKDGSYSKNYYARPSTDSHTGYRRAREVKHDK